MFVMLWLTVIMKYISVFFFIIMVSCNTGSGWQAVSYDESMNDNRLGTECTTTHQGEHELDKCDVYLDSDTLVIHFPAALPGYWGSVEVKVIDGMFIAQFDGVPFALINVKYETVRQKLVLDRNDCSINDTLYGYCDFTFKELQRDINVVAKPSVKKENKANSFTFTFKGMIREIVRDKDFDPLDPENFMTFDLPAAIRELGEPLERYTFNTYRLPEFDIELLNFFSPDENLEIELLTWNISDDAQVSDGGIERLTIWYAKAKDKEKARTDSHIKLPSIWEKPSADSNQQLPVNYLKWNINMQF